MTVMAAPKRHRYDLDPDLTLPAQCNGTNRAGEPCRRPTVIGSPVCWSHGGAAGHVRRVADQRVEELSARRALDATLARMNLDAPPIQDPAAAMANLAGRLLSGFEGVQARLNECREQGRVPNEVDLAERALWVKELRSLLTDMTRLQVGVQLAQRYAPNAPQDGQDGAEGDEQPQVVPVDLPDVSAIVAAVLDTEARLEHERLTRVAQQELPAGLTVVVEPEAESA